jgi:lysylphosphatidylglycerol synthase-like protein
MNRTSRYVSSFAAIAGIALLGYLLRRAGVSTVVQAIRLFGAGFLVLLFLSGIRQCLRAIAWRCCIDPEAHPQRLRDLFTLRLIGESVTDLSPAGPFLGETVKVWAVSKSIPARFGVTSVVIEDLIYSLGTGLFVLTGSLLLFVSTARQHHWVKAGGAMILLALATIILAILVQRNHLLGSFFLRTRNLPRGQALLARYGQAIRGWEAGIREFFRTRRKHFLGVLSIEIAVNVISFGETYLILKGATAHASFLNAYLVESANRCAQLVAAFVPFGLGVDEGTTTATLQSLGRTLGEGVSVAAIRKIRSLFWDFVGLGLAAHFMIARRAERRGTSLAPNQREDVPQSLEITMAERIP